MGLLTGIQALAVASSMSGPNSPTKLTNTAALTALLMALLTGIQALAAASTMSGPNSPPNLMITAASTALSIASLTSIWALAAALLMASSTGIWSPPNPPHSYIDKHSDNDLVVVIWCMLATRSKSKMKWGLYYRRFGLVKLTSCLDFLVVCLLWLRQGYTLI
jgi:hypothetical protein